MLSYNLFIPHFYFLCDWFYSIIETISVNLRNHQRKSASTIMNTIKSKKITWIDIEGPTNKDVNYLRKNFNFHPLVLEELIPPSYRSRVDHYGQYLFLILHVPFLNKETREIKSRELDIIVTKDALITSRYHSVLPLKALFDQCDLYEEARIEYMNQTTGHLLYHILERIIEYILPRLDFLEEKIDEIEDEIFHGKEKEMVTEISIIKRAVIDFRRVVKPQQDLTQSLLKRGVEFFDKKLEPYLFDLRGGYSKIWHTLENQRETIEALEDTNQSLLSTKTNEVMKVLTVFASIAFPLTLLASIFGMNVNLPFAGEPGSGLDFWIVSFIMIMTTIVLIVYFKKQKWL